MKNTRELESREMEKRVQLWSPPEMLPMPTPVPGWEFRWVRVSTMGDPDPSNISVKRREGWEPVKAEDHPELGVPTSATGRYAGLVEVGGLVLHKAPTEFMQQRAAYYEQMNRSHMESVDKTFFKEEHASMPMFKEGDSRVARGFGSGKSK